MALQWCFVSGVGRVGSVPFFVVGAFVCRSPSVSLVLERAWLLVVRLVALVPPPPPPAYPGFFRPNRGLRRLSGGPFSHVGRKNHRRTPTPNRRPTPLPPLASRCSAGSTTTRPRCARSLSGSAGSACRWVATPPCEFGGGKQRTRWGGRNEFFSSFFCLPLRYAASASRGKVGGPASPRQGLGATTVCCLTAGLASEECPSRGRGLEYPTMPEDEIPTIVPREGAGRGVWID